MCLNPYLQVKAFLPPQRFSSHLHRSIQTSGSSCDSAWNCHQTYIYNMFTYTIYRSTWTRSCPTALRRRHKRPHGYTGTDDETVSGGGVGGLASIKSKTLSLKIKRNIPSRVGLHANKCRIKSSSSVHVDSFGFIG